MGDIQCWLSPGTGGTQKQKATVTLSHFSCVRLLLFPLHWSIAVIGTFVYIQLNKIIMWVWCIWFVNDLHGRAKCGSYSFSLWIRHFAVSYKLSLHPHYGCCGPLLCLWKNVGFLWLLSSNWAMERRWSHRKLAGAMARQLTVLTNQWLSSLLWGKNQTMIDRLLGRCFTTKMTWMCVLAIHPPTFPVNAFGGNFFTTSLSSTSTLLRCISLGSSTDWAWRPDLELWSTGGKTTNQHKMKHRINDLLTAWGGGIVLTFFVLGKFPVIVFVRVISSIGDGYSKEGSVGRYGLVDISSANRG